VGSWGIAYDRLGSRLRQVGPFAVGYDRFGSRPRTVGDMTIDYDRLGSRPKSVTVPSAVNGQMPSDHLLALFFVLEHHREEEAKRHS
jgi:hypothetical protein